MLTLATVNGAAKKEIVEVDKRAAAADYGWCAMSSRVSHRLM